MPTTFPRLTLVQAQSADVAVVFRRGPTEWCAVLRWDTVTGDIDVGAWFKGRFLSADLSHDGRYLSTQLMKGGSVFDVISIAPWLHPLHSIEMDSSWESCFIFLGPDDPPRNEEIHLGPSRAKPSVRLAQRWTPPPKAPGPPAHLLPADLQWAAMTPGGRVVMAGESGKLQLAEIRGGDHLKVLSDFDTASLTPDPQPPPQHAMSWGTWSPPRRAAKKRIGKR